jgi:hypothetical protein
MVAGRDVAREDLVRFQRVDAAATRDQRGHCKRRIAKGPRNQPLEPRQHSPCPPHFPARATSEVEHYDRAIAVILRYQPRPRGSSGSRPTANAGNSLLPPLCGWSFQGAVCRAHDSGLYHRGPRRLAEGLKRAGSGLIGNALGRAGARPKRASIEMHFGQTLIEAFSNALRPPTTTPPRALTFPCDGC